MYLKPTYFSENILTGRCELENLYSHQLHLHNLYWLHLYGQTSIECSKRIYIHTKYIYTISTGFISNEQRLLIQTSQIKLHKPVAFSLFLSYIHTCNIPWALSSIVPSLTARKLVNVVLHLKYKTPLSLKCTYRYLWSVHRGTIEVYIQVALKCT